jgi:Reverse transcriptase (RNA-dependent DNA polymerase)
VAHGAFHPMQFGGVTQRSTEDAGVYLTHLVRAGWAEGLQTCIVAFDIAQFFPSINHEVLLRVIDRSGFPLCVGRFFCSYLVGRRTTYKWNAFMSGPYPADVWDRARLCLLSCRRCVWRRY